MSGGTVTGSVFAQLGLTLLSAGRGERRKRKKTDRQTAGIGVNKGGSARESPCGHREAPHGS